MDDSATVGYRVVGKGKPETLRRSSRVEWRSSVSVVAAVLCISAASGESVAAASEPTPLILEAGTVVTCDSANPRSSVVGVRGGRIVYVGDKVAEARRLCGGEAVVVPLENACVLPGLADAHGHLASLGMSLARIDLRGVADPEEVSRIIAQACRDAPPGSWIRGRGWDQNLWPGAEFPHRRQLDAVSGDHPVWLTRIDGHAGWANSRALTAAGIDASTRDPDGGRILREGGLGSAPTGVLIDRAMGLLGATIPGASAAEVEAALLRGSQRCARLGLTSVHDAGCSRTMLRALRRLDERGALPIRVYVMLAGSDESLVNEWLERGPLIAADPLGAMRVTVRSIKLMADGALGSRGAALIRPYSDRPKETGLLITPGPEVAAMTARALRAGFQVGCHAIGDRANRDVLDAYGQALKEVAPTTPPRLRLEHAQILALEDLPRLAALGVVASMQPTHATSDMPWAALRVGPGRIEGGYAWRSLLQHGTVLAFGSDFPVEKASPLLGLHAAMTRQNLSGEPSGGWHPEERLSADQALAGFTRGAAWASFEGRRLGLIRPGMLADLTVLDTDPTRCEPRQIPDARVLLTIVGGEIVYDGRR